MSRRHRIWGEVADGQWRRMTITNTARAVVRVSKEISTFFRDEAIRSGLVPGRLPTYWFKRTMNLGDQLSPAILRWVSGKRSIWVSKKYRGKILGVGSILGALAKGDVVWGAGSIRGESIEPPSEVKFLAVRGPLTRDLIRGDVPAVYGDPVLLLPRFHTLTMAERHAVGVIPHYVDRPFVDISDPEILLIDVRERWEKVVADILSCELILSSSLHGLIVAEAYGIPAAWIKVTDRVVGGNFKFDDYYLSTGRDRRQPIHWDRGIEEAIRYIAPPIVFDPQPLLDAAIGLSI